MTILIERVAFDAPKPQPDGYGGTVEAWSDPASAYECRADFHFMRGGETVTAARLASRQPMIVRIRASTAARQITPEWRMRDLRTGRIYNVRTIEPTRDRQFIEMMVEGGVAT